MFSTLLVPVALDLHKIHINAGRIHCLPDKLPVRSIRRIEHGTHRKLLPAGRQCPAALRVKLQLSHRNSFREISCLRRTVLKVRLSHRCLWSLHRCQLQLRRLKPSAAHRQADLPCLTRAADHYQQLAGEELPDRRFVIVIIRAVTVVHSQNPSRTGDLCLHIIRRIFHGIPVFIERRYRDEAQILAVGEKTCPVR